MRHSVTICAVVVLLLLSARVVLCEDQAATVVSMVERAAASFGEKGKDYTLRLLNASGGTFRKGSLYVFAVDFEGTGLAHAANKKFRGKNVIDLRDANGGFVIQELIKIVKEKDAGWLEYWWKRTGESKPTLKKTYVKRVPGEDIFVGCGYYVE